MHVDYARNRILDTDHMGLANPWLKLPLRGGAGDLRDYFLTRGGRYVWWGRRGPGVIPRERFANADDIPYPPDRVISKVNYAFMDGLENLIQQSEILFD